VIVYDAKGLPFLVREDIDLDFDGQIDQSDFYEAGKLIRQEIDLQWDQKIDVWKYYSDGQPTRCVYALVGNKGFYIEIYENGQIARRGKDLDGDGKIDEEFVK